MKDNTITMHPTVKTSTVYALELIAESKKVSIGKALEMCLEKDKEFQQVRDLFYNRREASSITLFNTVL